MIPIERMIPAERMKPRFEEERFESAQRNSKIGRASPNANSAIPRFSELQRHL